VGRSGRAAARSPGGHQSRLILPSRWIIRCTGLDRTRSILLLQVYNYPNKSHHATFEGITRIRERFPFPLKGIDSDNGSEFINHNLLAYCKETGLSFTRCRAYHKDDQAHIEEKNWDVVRRTIGYDRLQGQAACEQLDRIYNLLRIYRNCYLPAMKCIGKERIGSKVRKRFDTPTSPYRRAMAASVLTDGVRDALSAQLVATGPMTLKRQVEHPLRSALTLHKSRLCRHRVK